MSTVERLVIAVDEQGARVVQRKIHGIGVSAREAERSVGFLQRALTLLGATYILQETVRLADAYTYLQNRLKTVTSSSIELQAVQAEIYRISNDTRSSFEANVEMYARMRRASEDLGVSQQRIINFTKGLNQAMILSGATTVEAKNAAIQLSQGMAMGALRGDELRSVAEQLPVVLDVVKRTLGKTRGEIVQMGRDGQITTKLILEAFEAQADYLEEEFAKTIPTVGQAWQVFRNQLQLWLGTSDQTLQASRSLAEGIIWLGKNLDTVMKILLSLASLLIMGVVKKAIGAFTSQLKLLFFLIRANPITLLATALSGAATAFVLFGDRIKLSSDGMATVRDLAVALAGKMDTALKWAVEGVTDAFKILGDFLEAFWPDVQMDTEKTLKFFIVLGDTVMSMGRLILNGILTTVSMVLSAIGWAINKTKRMLEDLQNNFAGTEAGWFEREQIQDRWQEANKILGVGDVLPRGTEPNWDAVPIFVSDKQRERLKEIRKEIEELKKVRQEKIKGHSPEDWLDLSGIEKVTEESAKRTRDALDAVFSSGVSSTAQKMLDGVRPLLDEIEADAQRRSKEKGAFDLGAGDNIKNPVGAEAVKKLRDSYSDLLHELYPIRKAQDEYVAKQGILNRMLENGTLSLGEYVQHTARLKEVMEDQLDPMGAVIDGLREERRLMGLSAKEREVEVRLIEMEQQLRAAGLPLAKEQIDLLREEILLNQKAAEAQRLREAQIAREKEILDSIHGPAQAHAQLVADTTKLYEEQAISLQNLHALQDSSRLQMLGSQTTDTAGFERGFLRIKQQVEDLSTLTENMLVSAFQSAEDALVKFVTTGKMEFGSLVESILADLTRLMIRRGLLALLGGNGMGPGGVGSTGDGDWARTLAAALGSGFQHGTSFTVGGGGRGPDHELVMFRASKGERVDVTPVGQTRMEAQRGAAAGGGSAPTPNIKVVNVVDPGESLDALDSPAGERRLMNVIQRNAPQIRRYLR